MLNRHYSLLNKVRYWDATFMVFVTKRLNNDVILID